MSDQPKSDHNKRNSFLSKPACVSARYSSCGGRSGCAVGRKFAMITYFTLVAVVMLTCAQPNDDHTERSANRYDNDDYSSNDNNNNRDSSLLYTRLRYDDFYLPIYKNLQKQYPHLEESRGLFRQYNYEVHYYVNRNISRHDLSHNDLILESLDQVYKSRLLQSYEYNYDNYEDRRRASDPAKVDEKRCHHELDYLLSKLSRDNASGRRRLPQTGLDPELAAFFDSYASQEAGVLLGNVFWLGNWIQCNKRHIFDPGFRVSFTGRYCVASIRPAEWTRKVEEKVTHLQKIDYFKYDNQQYSYRQHFRIQLGICLPESCDSSIIDQRRQDIEQLSLINLRQPYVSYNLTDLYCLPDETSPLREIPASGRLLIRVSITWLLLLLVSTLADAYNLAGLQTDPKCKQDRNFLQRCIVSFSLIRSYAHLCNVSRSTSINVCEQSENLQNGFKERQPDYRKPSVFDLQFLDAFKVLAMMIILLGHIGMITLRFCQYQLDFHSINNLYFHFLASTAFYVDWFFCMTGFITTYTMFACRAVYTNRTIHWLYSVFHRYWRLAPIYVLTFWFCRSLLQYTSYGPLWDYGTSNTSLRAICQQESWLVPITLTSNLHPLHRECIMPAWYIANDMQFYLITPALLLLLAYRPRLGWLSLIGMSIASILARAWRYYTDSHAQHIELMHPRFDLVMRNNWDMHPVYLWPHYRISPYLIGLLAGHYAFMVKSGQWSSPLIGGLPVSAGSHNNGHANCTTSRPPDQQQQQQYHQSCSWKSCWRTNRAILAWFGLLVTCSMSMTSWILDVSFSRASEPHARLVASAIYAIGHSIAGFGIACLFLAILFGQWPLARRFMERPIWTKLARINFFVYLFQVEIIIWANNGLNRLPETSTYEQIRWMLFLGPILYALAWLVTLVVANPLAKLELEFVGVYMREHKPGQQQPPKKNLLRVDREKQEQVAAAAAAAAQPNFAAAPEAGALSSRQSLARRLVKDLSS